MHVLLGQEPGALAGNDDVVRPEAKGEEVEGDVYGMAVEVPRGDGHQDRAQHRVRSQRGDDQQSVQPLGKVSKKRIYSGLCPKHRTPPTHRARLGQSRKKITFFFYNLWGLKAS